MKEARESAARLYYNPDALPMSVVRDVKNPLAVYEDTKADEAENVIIYPNHEERQRIEPEYQACLSKVIDDGEDRMEKCLQCPGFKNIWSHLLYTLQAIGYVLKHLRWKKHKNNGVCGYFLKLR